MTPHTRTSCFDARLLRGLVGTTVTTYVLVSDGTSPESTPSPPLPNALALRPLPSHPPALAASPSPPLPNALALRPLPPHPSALAASPMTVVSVSSGISRTWVITEKLSERAAPMTDHDVKMGRGSPKTVGKFLYHLADDPKQIAFMRVYQQIPITGTEDADHDTLARQAVPPGVCGELECFKLLQSGGCSAVPRFLGHAESIQGEHDLVPGGYVRYLVWEKVRGEPLTEEFFWAQDDTVRKDIRSKFRAAYKQVLSCGVAPGQSRISKIIFDQSTGNLHISGFRRGWPIISKLEWSEARYVEYRLVKPSKETDWYLHPEKWEW